MRTQVEACSSGPGLNAESCGDNALFGVFDEFRVPAYEDAPPLAHRLVDVVDLEGDDARDVVNHGVRGPKDHATTGKDEVHRKGDWARSCGEDDPTDASSGEVLLTLLRREAFQSGVGAGAASTRRAIDLTTL